MMGKLRPINVADKQLYYTGTGEGNGACTIRAEIVFTEDIQPELLKRAAKEASRYIWPFRLSLVWHNGVLMHEEIDAEPPVYPRSDKTFSFATADTNGHMYYLLYEGKTVSLYYSHGLGDGTTGLYFCRFLVRFYLSYLYPEEMPFDAEDAYQKLNIWPGENQFDFLDGAGKQKRAAPIKPAFHIPEEHYLSRDEMYCMDMPREEFMRRLTELNTTPVPFMMALMGRAFRKTYKVGRRAVVALISADMRRVYGRNTIDGFFGAVMVPYEPAYDALDLAEVCGRLHTDMKRWLTRENMTAFFAMSTGILKLQESKWLSRGPGKWLAQKVEMLAQHGVLTYAITHVPLKKMLSEFGGKVLSMEAFVRNKSDGTIGLTSTEKTVSVRMTEYIGGQALLEALRQELTAQGIPCECSVKKVVNHARLDLSTLRNV